jgi:hypothetical protein
VHSLPAIGEEIAGCRLEGVLGQGGMGAVYRATELSLGRTVAVKVIAPDLAGNAEHRARFAREARTAATLEHPHVVPIYAAGEDRGRLYIVMRLIPGRDAGVTVAESGPLDEARAVEIVAQIADALDAAHRAGLVHRDVKPANILVATGDRIHAYLTDFGISKVVGSESNVTRTGHWLGTVDYAAPEQLRGEPVDARTDVYALGCVLFFLLSGRVPYEREGHAARLYAHLEHPVPSLASAAPRAGLALDGVVRRAMAKDPADRFATAHDLAAALRGAPHAGASFAATRTLPHASVRAGADADTAVAVGAPVPRGAPSRRGRTIAVLAAAALALAGGGAALALAVGGKEGGGEAARTPLSTSISVSTPAPAPQPAPQTAPDTAEAEPSREAAEPEPPPLAQWPASRSGWSVVLRSASTRASAQATARRAAASVGGDPGVLRSSDFASLRPGFWIAFADAFPSRRQAEAALPRYRAAGFTDAYVRRISDEAPAPPVPTAFNTGTSGGERYAAAHCRVDEGGLVCWTPNDGYTLVLRSDAPAVRLKAAEASNRGRDPGSPELAPGGRWESGGYACRSTDEALTCQNADGRGFRLPRYRGLPTLF